MFLTSYITCKVLNLLMDGVTLRGVIELVNSLEFKGIQILSEIHYYWIENLFAGIRITCYSISTGILLECSLNGI